MKLDAFCSKAFLLLARSEDRNTVLKSRFRYSSGLISGEYGGRYRKALPFDVAKAEIIRMSGSQFDPFAVETFLKEEEMLREMTALDHLNSETCL
jgi:hypothetical protein